MFAIYVTVILNTASILYSVIVQIKSSQFIVIWHLEGCCITIEVPSIPWCRSMVEGPHLEESWVN